LTDHAGVVARAFAIEVGFEPVSHRFVEQDAAVARGEHDFELAGWSFARVEHRDRLTRGLGCVPLGSLVVEIGERHPAAAAARSLLTLAISLRDGAHAETKQR